VLGFIGVGDVSKRLVSLQEAQRVAWLHLQMHCTNLHQNTNVLIIILIKAAVADGINTSKENFEELL